jgi:hypothetical protein
MKYFERRDKDHITSTLPDTLDPLQFACRPNSSTDGAIATTLHTALTHLDKRNTYVRMLLFNYSSAFNTIVPSKLIIKLEIPPWSRPGPVQLGTGLPDGRPQVVRVGNNISTPLILNTGAQNAPTRVRSEPSPILPVHPRLRGHAHLQLNHQVCRQHYSGRLDYQQQ